MSLKDFATDPEHASRLEFIDTEDKIGKLARTLDRLLYRIDNLRRRDGVTTTLHPSTLLDLRTLADHLAKTNGDHNRHAARVRVSGKQSAKLKAVSQ